MISHFATGIFQALKLEAVQGNGAHTNPVSEVGNHPNDVILRLKLRLQPKLHFLQLICDPTFYLLSCSSKSAFSVSNIFRVCVLFEGQSDSNLQHYSKLFTILRFNSRINHLILQTLSEELNSPLSEAQTTKSQWKDPRDAEEKKQCPRCFESSRTKVQNYYTSFKSYLVKNDLSYFIEMSSRVFFPLTYMAFIAYFFGTYGI